MDYGFGWVKDSNREGQKTYTDHLKMMQYNFARPLPATALLLHILPKVRNQLKLGACTGFGITGNLNGRAIEQGVYSEDFSPTWVYNGEREKEGTLDQDCGAMPSDGWDFVVARGCLLEHLWPYTGKLDPIPPPDTLESEAAKFPVSGYCRVDNGATGLMTSLAVGNLISIGTPWFKKWVDVAPDGVLPEVTEFDEVVGGHETFLGGYKPIKVENLSDKGLVGPLTRLKGIGTYCLLQNSWGLDWAYEGRCWIPITAFGVMKRMGANYDAHFPILPWKPISKT